MHRYSPLQVFVQVIFTLLMAATGSMSLEALQYTNGGNIFWAGLLASIIGLSSQATLLIYQIRYEIYD